MSNYKIMVEELAKKKLDVDIPNSTIDHATTILTAMVKNATTRVCFFSGKLDGRLFERSDFLTALATFLRKESAGFEVIVQNLNESEVKKTLVYSLLKELDLLRKCTFMVAKSNSDAHASEIHFQFADDTAYRKEYDTKEIKATANFCKREEVATLKKLFDEYKNQSNLVALGA